MRHWLVVLMILFTPLRGLAADVMAIAMAAQQGAPAHHAAVVAATAHAADGAALPDCAEHHAQQTVPSAPAALDAHADGGDDGCPTCASCMVCSSATLALQMQLAPVAPIHHALPAPGSAAFSSAAPRPGFKPPIS